jgi:uncharacterized protein with FMN-binding domain
MACLYFFVGKNKPKAHDVANVATTEQVAKVIYTEENNFIGYGGTTPLAVSLDANEKIVGVELLENSETPGFVNRIIKLGFFDSWNGMTVNQVLNSHIDAVAGATMTSSAVMKTLKADLQKRVENGELKGEVEKVKPAIDWKVWLKDIISLCVIIFALLSFFFKKMKKFRYLLLAINVIILGFWQGRYLSASFFFNSAINVFSVSIGILALMSLLALLLPLFTGKSFYCYYLCPFGSLQELVAKIPPKKKYSFPFKINKYLKWLQPTIFVIILILLFTNVVTDFMDFEPFAGFSLDIDYTIPLIIAGISLLISVFIPRFWCRYCCPTGFITNFLK